MRNVRTWSLFVLDVLLVGVATSFALILRDNFEISPERLRVFAPYLAATLASAVIVLTAAGTSRAIWRFSSLSDYIVLVAASFFITLIAVCGTFLVQRLDGLPRALPVLQWLLTSVALVGVRVAARLRHGRHQRQRQSERPAALNAEPVETVLVVGITSATDFYLRTAAAYGAERLRIAGILDTRKEQVGRFLHQHPVLGAPHEIDGILRRLEIHGIVVSRIIVTMPLQHLSPRDREALFTAEANTNITLEFIVERLGFESASRTAASLSLVEQVSSTKTAEHAARPYFRAKRIVDRTLAALVIVVCSPLYAIVALAVAIDVGWPLLFWQQRPGCGGRPFRVYKFRTMRAAHDRAGRRIDDDDRVSATGRFLRRTRLDELPQLYNIAVGEMSFIGPRPLLPIDQIPEFATRLLVPPGLTGWAQVAGGKRVSARDKAALDIWYVHNASLLTDLRIVWRTIPMLTFGERLDERAIDEAWKHLEGRSRAH